MTRKIKCPGCSAEITIETGVAHFPGEEDDARQENAELEGDEREELEQQSDEQQEQGGTPAADEPRRGNRFFDW